MEPSEKKQAGRKRKQNTETAQAIVPDVADHSIDGALAELTTMMKELDAQMCTLSEKIAKLSTTKDRDDNPKDFRENIRVVKHVSQISQVSIGIIMTRELKNLDIGKGDLVEVMVRKIKIE